MPQYRKTRRHLKSRRNRKTRRARRAKQRGGAVASAQEWITNAESIFNNFGETPIQSFKELISSDLTLSPPPNNERAEEVGGDQPMKIPMFENANLRYEDIRQMALHIRTKFKEIFGDNLEEVTPEVFISYIADPNRLTDDLMLNSLNYFLACENALISLLKDREQYSTEAPRDVLQRAAKAGPMFIWALAMNITGEVDTASLFTNAEQALNSESPSA